MSNVEKIVNVLAHYALDFDEPYAVKGQADLARRAGVPRGSMNDLMPKANSLARARFPGAAIGVGLDRLYTLTNELTPSQKEAAFMRVEKVATALRRFIIEMSVTHATRGDKHVAAECEAALRLIEQGIREGSHMDRKDRRTALLRRLAKRA